MACSVMETVLDCVKWNFFESKAGVLVISLFRNDETREREKEIREIRDDTEFWLTFNGS